MYEYMLDFINFSKNYVESIDPNKMENKAYTTEQSGLTWL